MIFSNTPFFWVLLAGHLLGDFYCQSQQMAADKQEHWTALGIHCLSYGCCLLTLSVALCGRPVLQAALAAVLGHAVIDGLKFHCREQLRSCAPARIFFADQLLHLAVLAAAGLWSSGALLPYVSALLTALSCIYAPGPLLRLVCLVLFLGKPSNILLKVCNRKPFESQGAQPPDRPPRDRRAGAAIGTLERLLTAALFLLGQYGAISVVFAAKTLTRYQRITNDPEFGEYYLIGTLGSLLLATAATLALFPPG